MIAVETSASSPARPLRAPFLVELVRAGDGKIIGSLRRTRGGALVATERIDR